jgi:hypothetical protein
MCGVTTRILLRDFPSQRLNTWPIANVLLLFSAFGLVFAFLLALADNFRLGRRFAFNRRERRRLLP